MINKWFKKMLITMKTIYIEDFYYKNQIQRNRIVLQKVFE